MGYSARYHAASLAAVFLALAVGILIGAGLGDNLLSDTEENLRESLEGDIEDARGEADDLRADLSRERAFADRAYPALVGDTLAGRRIGVVAFGDLSDAVSADIEDALEPSGAELASVVVLRVPPDLGRIASDLGRRSEPLEQDPDELEPVAEALGTDLVVGSGKRLDRLRDAVFTRSSGEGGRVGGVVVVRGPRGDLEGDEAAATRGLEVGSVSGAAATGVPVVAVERSDAEESSIPFFAPLEVATVDSVDLTSGRTALVFTLLGAEGNFGIKETANTLLPELLGPAGTGQR
ncbi:MAG: copper transporter [Solirubrobacterales bacterium]